MDQAGRVYDQSCYNVLCELFNSFNRTMPEPCTERRRAQLDQILHHARAQGLTGPGSLVLL
eukprot:8502056-Pyramimonas_sp.AAC.1